MENNNNNQGSESKFNAGLSQMKRIHELQEVLNMNHINVINFNPIYNRYNFEIIRSAIESLYMECRPKCTTPERESFENELLEYDKYLIGNPIIALLEIRGKHKEKLRPHNILLVTNYLRKLEAEVRILLDTHRMNSPSAEEEGGFD